MKKIILPLLIGLLCSTQAYASGNTGEYVIFGDYMGYDVKYRISNTEDVNGDGVEDYLLAASDIVMYKAVDKSTNKWIDTALREWLNSSEKQISWKGAVPDAYKDEAGFLSNANMSEFERNLIIPVTHKSIYPWTSGADGGSADWQWNDGGGKDFRLALTNYDSAYYKNSTDKVFIPSVKELADYNIPVNISAAESAGAASSNGAFFFRDATARTTNKMRYYYQFNYVSTGDITSAMGIRPMMYLNGNAVLKGDGTNSSPYYIKGGRDDEEELLTDEGGAVGEYVNFGDYKGYDVRYYIAAREDVNMDGVQDYVLATSDIIMYKAVDKSTNKWIDTSLREWLNSDEKEISWNGAVPDAYKEEAGFLSNTNMNSYERSLIIPVTHKSIYPWTGGADGGSADWQWNDGGGKDFRLALTNYDSAYYKNSTDKVFIPSVKELADYNIPVNVSAAESAGAASSNGAFFLRDATARTTNKMRYYYQFNCISTGDITSSMGIRTMLYLDGNAELCGNGTKESPYFVRGGRDGDGLTVKECEKQGDEYTLTVKNKSRSDGVAYLMAGVYEQDEMRLVEFYAQKVEVTPGRSKTVSVTVPDADNKYVKVFYWDTKYKPLEMHIKNMTETGKLVLNTDMFVENEEHMGDYRIENAFDSNEDTWFAVADLLSSSLTFAFKYPATLTSISFTHVDIDDWDMVKTIDIYAYNDNQVYRNKIDNPIYVGELKLNYPLFSNNEQSFDLSKYSKLQGITHLILKPTSLYTRSGKGWGGFEEMSITGSYDRNDISVARLTNPQILSSNKIMEYLGISLGKNPSADKILNALGRIGISAGNQSGEASMSAETFYSIVSDELGYSISEFKSLGIGSMFGIERLTENDAKIGICEALMTPIKGDGKLLIESLFEEEAISETAYIHIMDKLDVYKNAHISEFSLASNMSDNSSFEFTKQADAKEILSTNFCYNMPFHYEGGYLGTLPASNAKSKQTEFAKNLKDAGCESLRFPGGSCAHQYFTEGESYAQKLSQDIRKWGGLYDVKSETSNYYIGFYDFVDFCRNNAIEPIFQVNTSFYVEPSVDKIFAITKNRYVAETNGNVNSSYYDRDRIDEAAAALGVQIDKLLASGRSIKYWEIGNEEFSTLNYLGTSLSDNANPATENYAKISTAFIRVIKEKIPDAYIIVTGGFPNLESYYEEYGVLDLIDSMSTHYPFSNWTSPTARNRDNLTTLVSSNEVDFVKSAKGYTGTIPQCTTETMTYRFENWDSGAIQQTFAMALNTAHQWGEAVFETPWDVTTLHDLESSYFGAVLYNKKFNPETRYFVETGAEMKTEDITEDYRFEDDYMVSPSARAVALLSQHIGGTALIPSTDSSYRAVSAFASEKDGKVTLTVVNRMNTEKSVSVKLNGISLPNQTAEGQCLYSDNLSAMLPREYSQSDEQLTVVGDTVSFTARPYSIYQFILCE